MDTLTYSNPRMEAVIDNWPLGGSQRGQAVFAIETVAGKGQRATRFTIKNGKPSATKKLTYAASARIVDGSDGKTYVIERTMYGFVFVMRGDMKFLEERIGADDPRWPGLMTMLGASPEFIDRIRAAKITQHA